MFGTHTKSVLQALFVTFLWSTSWVFIKIGLEDIPALTFAGLRYTLAFLCLLPLAWYSQRETLRTLSRQKWSQLAILGLLLYTTTQGTQFVGLFYLPAITTNMLITFTNVVVVIFGIILLAENPLPHQWAGMGLYLLGVMVFFYPASLPTDQVFGLTVVLLGVLANAASVLLGRAINREGSLSPLIITVISMGIGAAVLLTIGVIVQGMPALSLQSWGIILWLAVVNTAFGFTLWNHTMRTLSAMESSIVNSAMMIQIPVLALIFLGEHISLKALIGMILAGIGILTVQLRRRSSSREKS